MNKLAFVFLFGALAMAPAFTVSAQSADKAETPAPAAPAAPDVTAACKPLVKAISNCLPGMAIGSIVSPVVGPCVLVPAFILPVLARKLLLKDMVIVTDCWPHAPASLADWVWVWLRGRTTDIIATPTAEPAAE